MSEQHAVPATPSSQMLMILGGIAMLSGFLVVLVYQLTQPRIADNQRRAMEQAVVQVLPGTVSRQKFILTVSGLVPEMEAKSALEGISIYAAYGEKGQLLGIAANAAAQGYADLVHLLYGYDPACACIKGIKVLKMAETPGLGDKIITDKEFQRNFIALDAKLNANQSSLEHPIVTVKHGAKRADWEIDAISGATVTSRAVGKALHQSADALLPKLIPQLDRLHRQPPPEVAQ